MPAGPQTRMAILLERSVSSGWEEKVSLTMAAISGRPAWVVRFSGDGEGADEEGELNSAFRSCNSIPSPSSFSFCEPGEESTSLLPLLLLEIYISSLFIAC